MPEGHDTTIDVSNIMFFVLYTQILKQSVLKPASPWITLNGICSVLVSYLQLDSNIGSEMRLMDYNVQSFFIILFSCIYCETLFSRFNDIILKQEQDETSDIEQQLPFGDRK